MPPKNKYVQICKFCARTGTAAVEGTSCSEIRLSLRAGALMEARIPEKRVDSGLREGSMMSVASEKRATLRGELNVVRLSGRSGKISLHESLMHAEGDFGGLPRSSPLKSDFFPPCSCRVSQCRKFSCSSSALVYHALPRFVVSSCHSTSTMVSQDYVSSVTLTEQIAEAGQLEPSFEHLSRDTKVDNGTILALRHCQITDRVTFVGLEDTQNVSSRLQWIWS